VVNELPEPIGDPPADAANQETRFGDTAVNVTEAGPHADAPVTVGAEELFMIALTATAELGQFNPATA